MGKQLLLGFICCAVVNFASCSEKPGNSFEFYEGLPIGELLDGSENELAKDILDNKNDIVCFENNGVQTIFWIMYDYPNNKTFKILEVMRKLNDEMIDLKVKECLNYSRLDEFSYAKIGDDFFKAQQNLVNNGFSISHVSEDNQEFYRKYEKETLQCQEFKADEEKYFVLGRNTKELVISLKNIGKKVSQVGLYSRMFIDFKKMYIDSSCNQEL